MNTLTKITNINELEKIFREAIDSTENSIAIEMTIPRRHETEIVFHRRESFFNRLYYYKKMFDKNLTHIKIKDIKIVAIGFGNLSLFDKE